MNGVPTGRDGWRRRCHASALLLAALLAVPGLTPARAQSSTRPSITVAATIAAEPASQAAFAIGVGPPGALPRNSFVRVRGLPPTAALSDGHSIAPGTWAVSLSALSDLKIMVPSGTAGRSEVVITLVAVDGSVLAEARSTLAIAAAPSGKPASRSDAGPPAAASMLRAGTPLKTSPEAAEESGPTPKSARQPVTPQDRERASRLMKKGNALLEDGDVSSARLFYERAADAGLAEAAMALAATHDKAEIARLKLGGILPDPKEARRWYERARQLGASGAEARLRQIGAK